jgi:hypothetical protein
MMGDTRAKVGFAFGGLKVHGQINSLHSVPRFPKQRCSSINPSDQNWGNNGASWNMKTAAESSKKSRARGAGHGGTRPKPKRVPLPSPDSRVPLWGRPSPDTGPGELSEVYRHAVLGRWRGRPGKWFGQRRQQHSRGQDCTLKMSNHQNQVVLLVVGVKK